jgi:hypothetical protein
MDMEARYIITNHHMPQYHRHSISSKVPTYERTCPTPSFTLELNSDPSLETLGEVYQKQGGIMELCMGEVKHRPMEQGYPMEKIAL